MAINPADAIIVGYLLQLVSSDAILRQLVDQLSFGQLQLPRDSATLDERLTEILNTILEVSVQIEAVRAELASNDSAILTAISNLPQVGDEVVLPASPPSGYGGSTTVGHDVWSYAGLGFVTTAAQQLILGADGAYFLAFFDHVDNLSPYFRADFGDLNYSSGGLSIISPIFDPSDLVPGESLLDTVLRQNVDSTAVWVEGVGGHVRVTPANPFFTDVLTFVTRMDGFQFEETYGGSLSSLLPAPPAWPGLDLVTLAAPVALDDGVTIEAPMHGVLIDLETIPSKQGYFTFDDVRSYRNVGALSFFSDNGYQEDFQLLNFTQAVYTPKAIAFPAGVKLRMSDAISGTITPWVINPPS